MERYSDRDFTPPHLVIGRLRHASEFKIELGLQGDVVVNSTQIIHGCLDTTTQSEAQLVRELYETEARSLFRQSS